MLLMVLLILITKLCISGITIFRRQDDKAAGDGVATFRTHEEYCKLREPRITRDGLIFDISTHNISQC